jgi:hypothetical protein
MALLGFSLYATSFAQKLPKPELPKFLGPGSCSASACHGGVAPASVTKVLQNEYSTWVVRDKHAQAYRVLLEPVAQRMGKILGIGKPESAAKCLACHALYVPAEQKGRDFDLSEGVSCESCHGPSSTWLGNHTLKGRTHEQSVALGMYDTEDLVKRAEKCSTCHVGTAEKSVVHEMIAAGHPDLVFEMDAYSAAMPSHWKKPDDPFESVRSWAVGQAVKLRESLKRLERRSQVSAWPEYAELDCFACHHSLVKAESSWRQQRGYPDRKPGNPTWNAAHFSVLRIVAREVDAEQAKRLDASLDEVFKLTSSLNPDRSALRAAAAKSAELASGMATRLNAAKFDEATSLRVLRSIAAQSNEIAEHGPRSAEQAAMALDDLATACYPAGKMVGDLRNALDGLYQQLNDPSAYNGPRFAEQMRRVGAAAR